MYDPIEPPEPQPTRDDSTSRDSAKGATTVEEFTEHIMQFFEFEHLPPHLRDVSRPFCALAKMVVSDLPRNPERSTALRKLLEAKDAAVRARLAK